MKYLIVSDIHGSIDSTKRLIDIFDEEKCDLIICGGDVLYHGPRNDLPENYCPKEVIKALNPLKDKILCVEGNCEAEVDHMVLDFDIVKSFDGCLNDIKCHIEHGHHLDLYKGKTDLIISGHTHIPVLEKKDDVIYLNPGSITIPKGGSERSFAIWDNHNITIYSIDKKIVKTLNY